MPYYLHAKDQEPTSGEPYDTRVLAHGAKQSDPAFAQYVITFVASQDEKDSWQNREYARFLDGTYANVPWRGRAFYYHLHREHYAHLSLDRTGNIAYTPSDEYGVQDRQLRTTPGRYLEKYAANHLTRQEIAAYVAQCKAIDGELKIARTLSEIRGVYLADSTPSSCMAHPIDDYHCAPHHPTDVYADSDLAVAYLGTLRKNISARCVIWPEQKIRTTVYGDSALSELLTREGYKNGSFHGARVRAIEIDDGQYVMPYVDGAGSAELRYDRDKNRYCFVLTRYEGNGYEVHNTDGTTGCETFTCANGCGADVNEDWDTCDSCNTQFCMHCGRREVDSADEICSTCEDDTFTCYDCNDMYCTRRGDHYSVSQINDVHGETYCDDCERNARKDCAVCDETFYPDHEFSRAETRERKDRHVHELCADCAESHLWNAETSEYVSSDEYRICDACERVTATDDHACEHCHRYPRCEHTHDLFTAYVVEPIAAPSSAPRCPQCTTILPPTGNCVLCTFRPISPEPTPAVTRPACNCSYCETYVNHATSGDSGRIESIGTIAPATVNPF